MRVMAFVATAVMRALLTLAVARGAIRGSGVRRMRQVALLALMMALTRALCLRLVALRAGLLLLRCGVRLVASGATRMAA